MENKSKVAITRCSDYSTGNVESAVRRAIALLHPIDKIIKPKSKVLLKPNLLMAIEPEKGVTTHPEVVRAAIRILKEIDCSVSIGDGPGAWGSEPDMDIVYKETGMARVAKEEGASLVRFIPKWVNGYPLASCLEAHDYIVNLPKFKTHDLMILTGAIKNMFGAVPGNYKVNLHRKFPRPEDFSKMLVDIFQLAKPHLTIIDSIISMEADGPASNGILKELGLIIIGTDAVAIDSILALIMGLKPEAILTTKEAVKRQLGKANPDQIEILGEKLSSVAPRQFILPKGSFVTKLPHPLLKMLEAVMKLYPVIKHKKCTKCMICVNLCPKKVISLDVKIIINYKGCISCFCCKENCPEGAIYVKKTLIFNLLYFIYNFLKAIKKYLPSKGH